MKMWPKVNKELLPMKEHYFLYNAGIAPVQPFMPVYAKYLGFSSVVVGTVYLILPITGMLAKPFFGAIADRFRLHKFLFILFQIVTIIAFFGIQFIPEISEGNGDNVNIVCGSQTNFHIDISNVKNKCAVERVLALSDTNETLSCSMKCNLRPDFLNEICYHWGAKIPECADGGTANKSGNVITETSHINGKKLTSTNVGKDFYAEKFKASSPSDTKVEFKVTIPVHHTINESNKLYFRVSRVIMNYDPSTYIPYCIRDVDASCHAECEDWRLAELLTKEQESELIDVVNMYQFWLLLCFLIASWVGMAVVGSISDAICFEMLGAKASQYGNQRLFGSIGWGVFAFLTGVIIDEFSKGKPKKNYTPIFYIMLIMLLLDVACMYALKYQQTKLSTQIFRNVGKLLKNVKVILFLVWCIIIGICIGIQWNFLFWYVEELATVDCGNEKWIKTLQGLLSGIQCFLGELPSFFFSGYLLKKFGHINVMSGILFFFGIRFILYSFLTNPWWCLPIEIFQGTVGLSFATMASYASIVAPSGVEATVQGLVGATFEGIGVSLGSFLGGYFFKNYGGSTCFRTFGLVSLGAFVLHAASSYLLRRSDSFNLDGKDELFSSNRAGQTRTCFDNDGKRTDSSMETINSCGIFGIHTYFFGSTHVNWKWFFQPVRNIMAAGISVLQLILAKPLNTQSRSGKFSTE